LDGASVVAVVGELEPAGMPQHVGMHEEREFRRAAFPRRYRMHAGISALGPAYMQAPSGEVDVVPQDRHRFRFAPRQHPARRTGRSLDAKSAIWVQEKDRKKANALAEKIAELYKKMGGFSDYPK
jgi:hypothetical protein